MPSECAKFVLKLSARYTIDGCFAVCFDLRRVMTSAMKYQKRNGWQLTLLP